MVLCYAFGLLFLLLLAMLWYAGSVLLLAFASILVAVLLSDATAFLRRHLRLPHGLALSAVLLLFVGLLALGSVLLAPSIAEQGRQLASDLPHSFERFRDYLAQQPAFQGIASQLPDRQQLLENVSALWSRASGIFSGVLGVVGNFFIIVFVAIYLAANSRVYTDGLITLVPPDRRWRCRQIIDEIGTALSSWLGGKLLSMLVVGVMTSIGLGLLGVPLALVLGVLTGLLDFIPYIGPIIAAVPALLLGFTESPSLGFYVLILYVGVQMLESYLLQPLVERRTVSMPPALTILMQVVMGLTFGIAGMALATPLTVVVVVLIAMLYVQDVLDDAVQLPGHKE